MENSTIVLVIFGITGLLSVIIIAKSLMDFLNSSGELRKMRESVDSAILETKNMLSRKADDKKSADDALTQMTQNTTELREFYTISKTQAQNAFAAALVACILGFALYAVGIIITYMDSTRVIEYTTIGGSVVEVIAGLFFWLYSKASEQMGKYHDSLIETQRQLSAIQLSDKMDEDDRNTAYAYIITKLMDKSQSANLEIKADAAESAQNGDSSDAQPENKTS